MFVLYCILFIPFPFHLIGLQQQVTGFFFGRLIAFTGHRLFGIDNMPGRIASDSVSLYVLLLVLFTLSLITAAALNASKKWSSFREKLFSFIYTLAVYYLALLLMKYGLDKIVKNQFYLPEPNTLYTPIGNASRGLLFWSTMGTSYFYSVFLGAVECLAAVFLLFKRTRLIGLLLSLGILLNVVAVNFGFDISVKLYSLFLLYITLYLLYPYLRALYYFFLRQQQVPQQEKTPTVTRRSFGYYFLKWFAVIVICAEASFPFIRSGYFNDDRVKRPFLHGVYEVKRVVSGGDTLAPADAPVKRFFIHRRGYLIFQDQEDRMSDYKLEYDYSRPELILTDYNLRKTRVPYEYAAGDSLLTLHYTNSGKTYDITGRGLDWRKMPALRKGFHWTLEGWKQLVSF